MTTLEEKIERLKNICSFVTVVEMSMIMQSLEYELNLVDDQWNDGGEKEMEKIDLVTDLTNRVLEYRNVCDNDLPSLMKNVKI
jgi:hypothetical protein